jgi:hypothetical protein
MKKQFPERNVSNLSTGWTLPHIDPWLPAHRRLAAPKRVASCHQVPTAHTHYTCDMASNDAAEKEEVRLQCIYAVGMVC